MQETQPSISKHNAIRLLSGAPSQTPLWELTVHSAAQTCSYNYASDVQLRSKCKNFHALN